MSTVEVHDELRTYFDQVREGKTTDKEVLWCAVANDGDIYTCYDGDWNNYATPRVHDESGLTLFYSTKPLTALLVRATLFPYDEYILRPSIIAASLHDHVPADIPLLADAHFYAFARYQSPHAWRYTSFGCMIGPCRIEATMRSHYGNDVRLFAPSIPFTL